MKSVIIKILISFIITYLGVSFLDWDLQWYQRLAFEDGGVRFLVGVIYILISMLVYCVINIIDSFI